MTPMASQCEIFVSIYMFQQLFLSILSQDGYFYLCFSLSTSYKIRIGAV